MLQMDQPASPLVLTKLRMPAARPRNLLRARLVDLVPHESGIGLVLVCAPAGYGKTTFLEEWARRLANGGAAVAWYALDPSDDDPIPFGSYLIGSFIEAIGSSTELSQLAQLLRSSPEVDLQVILPVVINAVVSSSRDCVLILDDYHLITSPAIHSAIAYLIEHSPANLCIAIGSRSDPPLPLARLRARGRLFEIRAASLRFTPDETAQFLNEVMRLDVSAEGISVLEERTEGWVAGLQLAALSLAGRPDKERFIASFTGTHRYLVEYLLEEVINQLPEEVQSFLLATSILERMCPPLCQAILGETYHCEEILQQLEKANLFVVALDDQGYWYRYHHLFRDFLQTRLHKTLPEQDTGLHRAACEWLAKHEFLREAARHAFQTQQWEYAAAFVEQHSFTMIIHSEIATIYEWCSVFPEEVMRRHPLLCIHQCWAWVFSFRRQNRSKVEERLRQAEQAIALVEDRQQALELSESAAVVRSWLAMAPDPAADPREQLVLAQHALAAYPEENAGQFSALLTIGYCHMALHDTQAANRAIETARQIALRERLYFGVVESTFHLARLAQTCGQLRRSEEICRQGQADIAALLDHPEQELRAVGCLDIALGCVLLEQDRLDEAEQHLLHGLDLVGWGMNPYYLMTANVALFRLYEIQGRAPEADRFLSNLEAAWPDIAFYTQARRVTHALRLAPQEPGTLADAQAWHQTHSASLGEDGSPPGTGPFGAAEVYYLARLARAHIQIALSQSQAALTGLGPQLALSEAHEMKNRVIELSLIEAQAAHAQGDHNRTWASLERAMALAQPEEYVRSFDQGPSFTRLLVEAAGRGIYPEKIGRIITAIGMPGDVKTENTAAVLMAGLGANLEYGEHLSERELEVLSLMAKGASNQVIAAQLVITVGTVKSHINHILAKLDAHNRTEAVARARNMGLLEI